MAAGSLLALLDDIASVLDDVSILTKKAAAKSAGLLGDDLALNAEQVSGVVAKRELPVVWAVAKGSALNKLILVPLALLISAIAPWTTVPLLMVGGLYLSYEGVEKLHHALQQRGKKSAHEAGKKIAELAKTTLARKVELEAKKIKGAVRTDFILSAEIIAITLGTVAEAGFLQQLTVLTAISVLMTVGVYGLVAGIVKMDDLGLWLARMTHTILRKTGAAILWAAPFLMKTLSILGTAAMFLVGGGILVHGFPWLHHHIEHLNESLKAMGGTGAVLSAIAPSLLNGICGLIAGVVVWGIVTGVQNLRGKLTH